jgi:integrase
VRRITLNVPVCCIPRTLRFRADITLGSSGVAYIRKQRDLWRAEVARNGVRKSSTFATKAAATQWAAVEEAAILAEKRGAFPRKTFGDALTRYVSEVSVDKKGERFERMRCEALKKNFPKLAAKQLTELTTPDMAAWRDTRRKTVTPGSVQRDINLLSHVFTTARDEWKWMGDSPLKGMKAPGQNPPRTRRIDPREVRRLVRWLGYKTGAKPATKQQEVALAFMLSLRTGMRAGEILTLGPATVNMQRRVATVEHKTQHITGKPREVPLSRHAIRLLRPVIDAPVFTVTSASLDALFRKARGSLLIDDLHFHDARADALTRMSKKVDVMTLARISGHRDLRVLMDAYYRVASEDIAARLD